ncbi:toll, putative [Pediculus humanus corporis]|uniref:Toll, putative n=1 Tax=Pediculus humanus subsp. corporis TaxID=121224 RepID=E0VDA3_PEDHC|nr:toll, putative [Pediculus humanus corporis]EEB11359.1 toll, putative [Pediculus humanus corporis]
MNIVTFTIFFGATFSVLSASLSKALRYQAPDECKWLSANSDGENTAAVDDEDVALVCRLGTINSEVENTNFSVIQPQHTVRLRLECNNTLFFQSSLNSGSFRSLVELKELSIEYCKIGNLTAGAFKGLKELRNLTLRTHNTDWSAMTLHIQPDAFEENLDLLQRLDLGENNIWTLADGVFCPLHKLEYLNLTRNRLRNVTALRFGGSGQEQNTNKCGSNLVILDLSNNSIDVVPPEALSGLLKLKKLYLNGNGMSLLADRALEGLISLTVLSLNNNKLVNLPPELFSDKKDLKELYLQNNSINVLAPGLFNDLTQLIVLDLSRNELTSEWVNSATFTGMLHLVVLDVSYNRISKLEPSLFRDLYRLQILKLEGNVIESIPENTFSSLYNLHTLILSNNRLSVIESYTFSGLYVLSLLSLDNNDIESIDPQALKNSSSLQDLHLNGNKLLEVPLVLSDVPLLKTLDLGENHITNIANSTFGQMQHMYGLRLTENNIGNISKGIFDKMSSLKILNLSRNKIQKVEPGAFDNNVKLQAIRLDGNYLSDIGGLFAKLPNLIWLNISDNRLEWFDYALIPTGLQWLDIHANRITELGNYFEIESHLRLSTFDASANKLTEITGSAIPDSVELLFLNDNLISKVQSYTFFKKPNLTRVDLYGNKITSLNPNSLRISAVPADKLLPEFYIGGNPYECDCTMEWLQKSNQENRARNQPKLMDLESIYCKLMYNRGRSYIPLVEVESSRFLCQYEFHCFALCHCCDFDACDCKMTCPNNCTCYHDQSWSANVVDCTAKGYVNALPERIPMDATQLYLDGNDLQAIGSHAFIGRKKLKILYMNSSNIEIIHNRTFNGLKELELLRLDNNNLQELNGQEFEGLENLRQLYLQNNKIVSINNDTFLPLRHLEILRLDNNKIKYFAVWHLSPSLTSVSLSNNHWSCECEYTDRFREWIETSRKTITDLSSIKCMKPTNRTDVFEIGFFIVNDNSTSCEIEPIIENTINMTDHIQDYLPLLVATMTAFLTIIVVILVIFLYRQEMRVWFYSRFGVRLFYKSTELDRDDRDKLFDAFVSYSSKDEAWVAEELAPMLEHGDPSYKLCLHYRDFPVNAFIADTIVQAVESSRRTIMVLSENFIKSEWCRFEFKSAHHQVLRDRRKRLIVVLLGEVPQKDLDPDIRLYLKTNTYLQWGDKLFWEKLRFALPDVPNNQRTRSSMRNSNLNHHHMMHHIHRHNNHNNIPPVNTARSVAIHI